MNLQSHLFRFATRNVVRNARRSAVTIVSIASGFIALGIFGGFTKNVYRGLELEAVYAEMLGHLTISKSGLRQEGHLHPDKYMLSVADISKISDIVRSASPTAKIAQRLQLNGLMSNGVASTIFIAEGVSPRDMRFLRGPLINAPGALDPNEPSGITVANGLASILGLKEGDDASLLVSTLRGQANVIDGKIIDTFDTGATGTNDKLIFMPLAHAQSLMDAEGRADRLTVVLSDIADSPAVMEKIQGVLKDDGYDVESWSDLSSLYKPVKSMYDMIFTFLLTIVLIISAMGLGNVISMNVVERTREIGALRALGMRQGSVARLIIAEALVLVVIGCVVGFATTLGLRWAINACHISWTPPTSSTQVPLTIGLSWVYLAALPVLLCLLSILAAFVPARRATRSPIVEALGHV